MDFLEVAWVSVDCIPLAQDQWRALMKSVMNYQLYER